jgi:hypothetical protein
MDGVISEFFYWSPVLGADAARISMANEDGAEYFVIIEKVDGVQWRNDKQEAIEALQRAIDEEREPGEVSV